MSDLDTLKTQFQSRFDALQSVVADTIKQIFQQEGDVTIESTVSDDQNLSDQIGGEEFPRVLVSFTTKSNGNNQHIISMETAAVAQLYAWMIGAEPEETVGDDQLEGLKEAANQVFGQLTAVADGEAAFTFDGLTTELTNSTDDFSISLPEEGGLGVSYSIAFGETTFSFGHYSWEEESADGDVAEDENIIDGVLGTDDLELSEEEKVDIAPAEFDDFAAGATNGQARNMDMLLDVELEVLVELGKRPMKIQDVLKLGKGSVVELEKNAGEPLEVFVNNRKLAEGEVVVVDDHFGIRITQLVSPRERIKNLG